VELANSITDLIIPATDPTIVSALALTLLRLTSLFLFVARPSVLILIPSIVANPGLLDLLNTSFSDVNEQPIGQGGYSNSKCGYKPSNTRTRYNR
jgi:hypothetical protein